MHIIYMILLGTGVSFVATFLLIPILKKRQFKQYIREEGPKSHLSKEGTPTMGGIGMIIALIISLLIVRTSNMDTLVMTIVTLLFGAIGFLDDYIKVAGKHNLGLRAWQKIVLQVIFATGLGIYMANFSGDGTSVFIPFISKYIDFGYFYIPFVAFVVVAMANSVNLSDGLDGLSSGITAIVSIFFAIIAKELGQVAPMDFAAILAGVCLGYLWFNKYPAKLFMGDTGSMALGGGLAALAILMKMEFLLVIAGLIYVIESLSVIIQVLHFKRTGKRVFRMSPIHHHFEVGGMKETRVVLMFYVFTLLSCIAGYLIFNI